MIRIDIPGFGNLSITDIVMDYNGTIAVDGHPVEGLKDRFEYLDNYLNLHVITADTHGTVVEKLKDYKCRLTVISGENQDRLKSEYIRNLGADSSVSIGNGKNDSMMLKCSKVGIAVVMEEGCAIDSLLSSDIVVRSVLDALDLFINQSRIRATLRNS